MRMRRINESGPRHLLKMYLTIELDGIVRIGPQQIIGIYCVRFFKRAADRRAKC